MVHACSFCVSWNSFLRNDNFRITFESNTMKVAKRAATFLAMYMLTVVNPWYSLKLMKMKMMMLMMITVGLRWKVYCS